MEKSQEGFIISGCQKQNLHRKQTSQFQYSKIKSVPRWNNDSEKAKVAFIYSIILRCIFLCIVGYKELCQRPDDVFVHFSWYSKVDLKKLLKLLNNKISWLNLDHCLFYLVKYTLRINLLMFRFCNILSFHSSFCIHTVEYYYILININSHCDLWMIISGGGIAAGWERGEVARCVWARSVCSWGGSLCAVLGWAGLSVPEENRLVGTRGPPGRSASHADGRDQSVWSLPHRRSHQPTG